MPILIGVVIVALAIACGAFSHQWDGRRKRPILGFLYWVLLVAGLGLIALTVFNSG
jgi:hypothetical protein